MNWMSANCCRIQAPELRVARAILCSGTLSDSGVEGGIFTLTSSSVLRTHRVLQSEDDVVVEIALVEPLRIADERGDAAPADPKGRRERERRIAEAGIFDRHVAIEAECGLAI